MRIIINYILSSRYSVLPPAGVRAMPDGATCADGAVVSLARALAGAGFYLLLWLRSDGMGPAAPTGVQGAYVHDPAKEQAE